MNLRRGATISCRATFQWQRRSSTARRARPTSYSMQQHYQDKHHGVEMPADLAALVELKKHEREHVMQKLTKKGKVDNMCPGPHCCPKRQKTSA